MTIITIAAAGIATVLLAVQLKGLKGEYAAYMVMAAGAFIFFYGTGKLKDILEALERIQGYIKVNSVYLVTLLKMVGITYVAEFASGICKDAGYGSLGNQIEIFGKLSIWVSVWPILLALLGHWRHFGMKRWMKWGVRSAALWGLAVLLPVSRDGQAALFTALRREGSWRDSRKNSGRSSGRDSGGDSRKSSGGDGRKFRAQRQAWTRHCRIWGFRMRWRGFSSFWTMLWGGRTGK